MPRTHVHINYYILETFLLGIGFFFIYSFLTSYALQAEALGTLLLAYVIMGVSHHTLEHDIKIKVVVEYILISILVFVIFTFLKTGTL